MGTNPVKRSHGRGHGGPRRGYTWEPFEPENDAAVTNGALCGSSPAAASWRESGRFVAAMGGRWDELYAPAVEAGALAGARLEAAMGVLLEEAEQEGLKLSSDARAWLHVYPRRARSPRPDAGTCIRLG
jgi:hypothetical protein